MLQLETQQKIPDPQGISLHILKSSLGPKKLIISLIIEMNGLAYILLPLSISILRVHF